MRDHRVWSLSLGRWGPVQVRLHMFFLLFAALTVFLGWHYLSAQGDAGFGWLCPLFLLVLLVSVVLHEFGHYLVAVRLGGGADQLVLGPLGGLAPVRVPFEPRSELAAILAGPVVNLVICLMCLTALLVLGSGESQTAAATFSHLINPLSVPFAQELGRPRIDPMVGLQLTLWINWVLFLVNMIPAFPFDGGRAFLALLAISPYGIPARRRVLIVAAFAKMVAIGLLFAAWFLRNVDSPNPIVPTWLALVLLSIFLFFSARKEESQHEMDETDEEVFGYDFSQGYTSLEPREDRPARTRAPFSLWLERRREQGQRRQRALEEEEDQRMDEILARLHVRGLKHLSHEERALLKRVSARFRSRLPK